LVTPVGVGVANSWAALQAGTSGIKAISAFAVEDLPSRVAGVVEDFAPEGVLPPKEIKKCDRFIQLGWVAAHEALTRAGLLEEEKLPPALQLRAGVILGSGIGGLPEIERGAQVLQEKGPRRISPFFIPAILTNSLAGQVSIAYGLKGPNSNVVTACATGSHCIGEAFRTIQRGEADVMVAGGAEAAITRLSIAGFAASRALSTGFNETPAAASRPFDAARDGFVMGEGAGVLVMERLDHARARKAHILAEIVGFGQTGDAYHMTAPAEDGDGAIRAMQAALNDADLTGADVDYVNAHATSTPLGDAVEARAIAAVCGEQVVVSATKSMTGHMLGAAGGVEAAVSILALQDQVVPPTINAENPEIALDIVPHHARPLALQTVLSNSFGFSGTNAALVFQKAC
jgi:3-oxoacyl-[acyl-carrier-protein] synthase II